MRVSLLVGSLVVVVGGACTEAQGEPTLEISLSPRAVTDATPVTVRVAALGADGRVGSGVVTIKSESGSLTSPVSVELDTYGTARVELVCDPQADSACAQRVTVTAEWTSGGVRVVAEARLEGMTGAGGGTGNSGGPDAGFVLDPRRVYLYGSLWFYRNSFGVIQLDSVTSRAPVPAVAFPDFVQKVDMTVTPDGGLRYATFEDVFLFTPEPWPRDSSTGAFFYPSPTARADDRVGLAPCTRFPSTASRLFMVWPDTGGVVTLCDAAYYEKGQLVSSLSNLRSVDSLGYGGHAIGEVNGDDGLEGAIVDAMGNVTVTATRWTYHVRPRARPDGFIVVQSNLSPPQCEQWFVRFDGSATLQGVYADAPPDAGVLDECAGTLDADGVLYTFSHIGKTWELVVARPLVPGRSEVVYDQGRFPTPTLRGVFPDDYVDSRNGQLFTAY